MYIFQICICIRYLVFIFVFVIDICFFFLVDVVGMDDFWVWLMDEQRLYKELLCNYDRNIWLVYNVFYFVNVNISIFFIQIFDVVSIGLLQNYDLVFISIICFYIRSLLVINNNNDIL